MVYRTPPSLPPKRNRMSIRLYARQRLAANTFFVSPLQLLEPFPLFASSSMRFASLVSAAWSRGELLHQDEVVARMGHTARHGRRIAAVVEESGFATRVASHWLPGPAVREHLAPEFLDALPRSAYEVVYGREEDFEDDAYTSIPDGVEYELLEEDLDEVVDAPTPAAARVSEASAEALMEPPRTKMSADPLSSTKEVILEEGARASAPELSAVAWAGMEDGLPKVQFRRKPKVSVLAWLRAAGLAVERAPVYDFRGRMVRYRLVWSGDALRPLVDAFLAEQREVEQHMELERDAPEPSAAAAAEPPVDFSWRDVLQAAVSDTPAHQASIQRTLALDGGTGEAQVWAYLREQARALGEVGWQVAADRVRNIGRLLLLQEMHGGAK